MKAHEQALLEAGTAYIKACIADWRAKTGNERLPTAKELQAHYGFKTQGDFKIYLELLKLDGFNKPVDIVREYFPGLSDSEADAFLWNETGFPSFWRIPEDGRSPEECLRRQLRQLRDSVRQKEGD